MASYGLVVYSREEPMFNDYYYLEREEEEAIYFSIITINNAVETSLYQGRRLLSRQSLQRGVHLLKKDKLSLKVQIKWFKVIPELKIDGEVYVPEKLKRKELQKKLATLNIHNEINPKEIPKEPFQLKSIISPLIIITLGALWQWLSHDWGKLWGIPNLILYFIASISLFGSLVDRIPKRHINDETRGKLMLIIGIFGMMTTLTLIDKLIILLS